MKTINLSLIVSLSLIVCSCNSDGELDGSIIGGFLIGIFAVIMFLVYKAAQSKKAKNAQNLAVSESRKELPDFSPTKEISMPLYYIAFDDNSNKCLFIAHPEKHFFSYSDIISAEISVDGDTMVETQALGKTVGRSLLGAAIGGGVGAAIGGLSTPSDIKKKISSIIVHVLLRNQEIRGFDIQTLVNKETNCEYDYKLAYDKAREILDLLKVAIDKAEKDFETEKLAKANNLSIVDKLKELAELKTQGVITEEEFKKIKKDLLSQNITS